MIILGKCLEELNACNKGFLMQHVGNLKELGAADHSNVEWDVGFNLVLSTLLLCPSNY